MVTELTKNEKERIFFDLLSKGREFYYDSTTDILYSDVNHTLTDDKKHLGLSLLKNLDEEIFKKSIGIWNQDRDKESKIRSISGLLAGKTLLELRDASEKAVDEITIPEYLHPVLSRIQPTKLVLWSDTPRETIEVFSYRRVNPIYNSDREPMAISIYATELEHHGGVLTGGVKFIPTTRFRHDMQTLESLRYKIFKN